MGFVVLSRKHTYSPISLVRRAQSTMSRPLICLMMKHQTVIWVLMDRIPNIPPRTAGIPVASLYVPSSSFAKMVSNASLCLLQPIDEEQSRDREPSLGPPLARSDPMDIDGQQEAAGVPVDFDMTSLLDEPVHKPQSSVPERRLDVSSTSEQRRVSRFSTA